MRIECNISKKLPGWISKTKKAFWEDTVAKIYERYEKLNEALDLSGVAIEQFIQTVQPIFLATDVAGNSLLDSMDVQAIAELAKTGANAAYIPREEFPNADVLVDTAFLTTREWEIIRMTGIGGSDAAVCMHANAYRTPRELFWDKTGVDPVNAKPDPGKKFIFAYGHCVEPLVIDTFCKMSGATVIPETRMFVKKGYPYITANIDGIVRMPDGELKIFEAKTTTNFNKGAWDGDQIPPQYIPQITQYMSVLNDPRIKSTFIGCIYGNTVNDFKCKEYVRDLAAEEHQIEVVSAFWEDHIVAGELPELSGDGEKDLKDLKEYANPQPQIKAEDVSHLKEIVQAFQAADAERSAYESLAKDKKALCDALKAQIIDGMGSNDTGFVDLDGNNAVLVSWKSRGKDEFDKKKLKKEFPEAYDACVTHIEDASRTFSVKEKLLSSINR